MASQFLFAYGTLQPRFAPAKVRHLINGLAPVGEASVKGKLYHLGKYPGALFLNGSGLIKGFVYRLPELKLEADRLLKSLDDYEGVNERLFVRKQVSALVENGKAVRCWAYEYRNAVDPGKVIADGRFSTTRRTPAKRSRRKLVA